jgi:hypothetical protein
MSLLHRKVLPRAGSPTRITISFCLSTRFLRRVLPRTAAGHTARTRQAGRQGACEWGPECWAWTPHPGLLSAHYQGSRHACTHTRTAGQPKL